MKIPGTGRPVLRLRKAVTPETGSLKIPRQILAETSDWKKTETTRYLCAAAHLDEGFRDHVLSTLIEEKHRAIAISYGVDIATLLNHCLVARRRKRIRNLFVALAVAVSYVVLYLGGFGQQQPGGAIILAALIYFLLAWPTILAEKVVTEHNTVRMNLTKDSFDPDCVARSGLSELPQDLSDARNSNVMVYSGFSPFVGAGINLGGWSFAVDISKGKQELGRKSHPETFEVRELYSEVCSAVSGLGLGNAAVEDKLCVNGQDIRNDPRFLPELLGRPRTRVEQGVIDNVLDNPTASVRHYKQIRIVDWGGELVFSYFLRFAKLGYSLFIETTACLLTPVHDRYQKVDAMNPDPGVGDWFEMGISSFVVAALVWWLWPFWLIGMGSGLFAKRRNDGTVNQTIRKDPTFDRGAFSSIREYASSPVYQRYFQKLDKEMYIKILQQQIIDVIVLFLDAKGIDTTELKERQTSIVNSGVIVSGDLSVQGESVAFGAQAQAVKRERSRTAQA